MKLFDILLIILLLFEDAAGRPVESRGHQRRSTCLQNVTRLSLSSAIKKGYFVDNYAEEFTQYRGKRDIIIHRGYWARVFVVRKLIETMIEHGTSAPIQAKTYR